LTAPVHPRYARGVALSDLSDNGTLRASLEQAMAQLPQALEEPFTRHPLGRLLVREIPDALAPAVAEPGYKLQGSPGRGRWAETVWVSVFDRLVTTSAQNGYYLVYLFREDGAGVHLSLNQGTTAVHAEVGGRRYLPVLRDRATVYADLLGAPATQGLDLGPIDLGGGGKLTRGYEAGNIAAIYYPSGAVPSDEQLFSDLGRMLVIYKNLVEANDYLAEADNPTESEADTATGEPDGAGTPEADVAIEAKKLRWHLRAERNPKLARDAKRIHGSTCQVCGFIYKDRYGEIGDGYIEAHHITPFSELADRPTQLDPAADFAVVCASCHRMIHRRRPPYDLDTIRDSINANRT
jgi:5-methylcytosine-specific restriction enzyme A